MPIGVSAAPYMKFENKGDRCGGEIVAFRVVQNRDQKTRMPLYLTQENGIWEKTSHPFCADGRPNDPICQWEVTVDTGVEDAEGETERRIFIDPRKGRRGTTVEGKKGGDAIAAALKKVKAHRVGLEIGGHLFVTFEGKILDGDSKVNTWSAEYQPPAGGPGTGQPVDEMPWLVGGARYDKSAELAKWERATQLPALARSVESAQEKAGRDTTPAEQEALDRLRNQKQAVTRQTAEDDEPPF